jgi:hypothetical protein
MTSATGWGLTRMVFDADPLPDAVAIALRGVAERARLHGILEWTVSVRHVDDVIAHMEEEHEPTPGTLIKASGIAP